MIAAILTCSHAAVRDHQVHLSRVNTAGSMFTERRESERVPTTPHPPQQLFPCWGRT
jgi:hypothetical protein